MKFMPLLGLVAPDVQGEHAIGWELSTQDRAELICLATIMFCGLVASLWYFWASTPFQERRVQKIEDEAAPENCAESPGVLVLLVLAIQAFLSTALVPGWPAFIGLLHQEGVYAHYCADISDCPERSVAFSFVFTVGSVMSYVGSLPAGYFVDYMGQRRGMQVGVLVVMAGSILMAIAPASGNLVWPLAFGLYGMGGCFVTLANFSASKGSSNLPIVVGILMALRVTSGMTLELFSLAYRAGLARSQVMMIHVLVLGLCLAISSSCWSGRAPGPSATTAEESTSVMEQIRSKKFLVILGFHMTMIFTYRCMLSFRYDELMWKKATFASSMDVQWQLDIFTVSQYSLNIFMIPVFAYVVEKFGHRQAPYLLCATLHLLWQCMRLVPGQWILPLFDLTTAMHRHAFASTHYMFLSAEFPTQVYARLIGIGHLVAAFVNLLPTPLLALVFWHFEGDFMVLLLSQLCIAVALFLITNLAWPFKPETEAEKNLEKLTA